MTRLSRKLGSPSASPKSEPSPAQPGAKEACFEREEGSASVSTFYTTAGDVWLFPGGQFLAAQGAADGKKLRVCYGAAEVRLEGENLNRILDAIVRGQSFRLRSVSPGFKSEYREDIFLTLVQVVEARPPKEAVNSKEET